MEEIPKNNKSTKTFLQPTTISQKLVNRTQTFENISPENKENNNFENLFPPIETSNNNLFPQFKSLKHHKTSVIFTLIKLENFH